ncbi:MAG: hypothetical protein IJG36_04425 [Synergistaceae bacterium]|nr:hypothetical protein [Synergistaceae bacterium]
MPSAHGHVQPSVRGRAFTYSHEKRGKCALTPAMSHTSSQRGAAGL